nr:immunoglobulin heavy chain precursor [Anarhichas minor]
MFSVALLLLLAAGCLKCEQLTQTDSETVQPGQRLTITCQVSYALSSYNTAWIRQPAGKGLEWIGMKHTGASYYKDSLKNKFSIDLETSSKTVTLNGQNVQPEDTAVYYCARSGTTTFDYWGKGTMVTVTSVTSAAPTVFPLMQCGSGTGNTITLGCFATGFAPSALTFAWNKVNGDALTGFIQYPPVQKGDLYTGVSQIRVSRQDWDAKNNFRCAVKHATGDAEVIFKKPIVAYSMPTLKVLASSYEATEVSFSCFAKDFSPKDYEFKWLKDDEEIPDSKYEVRTPAPVATKDENGTTLYSTASFLTVPSSEWSHPHLTCQFKGKGEHGPTYVNASLTYKDTPIPGPEECLHADADVTIEGPSMEDIFSNGSGTVKCNVKVHKSFITKVSWEDQNGAAIPLAVVHPTKESKAISVPLKITYEEWSKGTPFICIVEHDNWIEPRKETYKRIIGGETRRPSVFMLPPLEHTSQEMVTLTCYVKDFFPKEVFVSWLVDDEIADSKQYKFHTTNPIGNHESYSTYGQLSLTFEQWKDNDMVFSCVVHHESVANTTKAIVRSIGHRTFERTNLVNLNINIPEPCKA